MKKKKLSCYKVWNGRYSKIVRAESSDKAIRKSKYKNADQVEKLKRNKC